MKDAFLCGELEVFPTTKYSKNLILIIMKSLAVPALLIMTLALSACVKTETPEVSEEVVELEVIGDYVGMTVPQAQAQAEVRKTPFRVVMADGEAFAVTEDYRPGRINATVENGVVTSYSVEGEEAAAQKKTFDARSWKTEIAESCSSFFDGCNTCRRVEGAGGAACTRMFCGEYKQPRCLDEENVNASDALNFGGRSIAYACEAGNTFSVSYDQYVGDNGVVRLQPDQVRFEDEQTNTKTVMSRTVAASGEKYESEAGLVFWSKGLSATVMQGEVSLYENCEEV